MGNGKMHGESTAASLERRLADRYLRGVPLRAQHAVFQKAWDDGHASGEHEIEQQYQEIALIVLAALNSVEPEEKEIPRVSEPVTCQATRDSGNFICTLPPWHLPDHAWVPTQPAPSMEDVAVVDTITVSEIIEYRSTIPIHKRAALNLMSDGSVRWARFDG